MVQNSARAEHVSLASTGHEPVRPVVDVYGVDDFLGIAGSAGWTAMGVEVDRSSSRLADSALPGQEIVDASLV